LTDVDVLEAAVEQDEKTPPLPGLRIHVYFRGTTPPARPATSIGARGASNGTAGTADSPDSTTATKP
jgi:hypothetical protein